LIAPSSRRGNEGEKAENTTQMESLVLLQTQRVRRLLALLPETSTMQLLPHFCSVKGWLQN